MSNHVNRFYSAVKVLAGSGHIKQRLIQAFEDNLLEIEAAELPHAIKQPFRELRAMMSQVDPLNGEGPICASVRKMSVDEAAECAHRVIDLFTEVIRHEDDTQEALPRRVAEKPRVPPFLAKAN